MNKFLNVTISDKNWKKKNFPTSWCLNEWNSALHHSISILFKFSMCFSHIFFFFLLDFLFTFRYSLPHRSECIKTMTTMIVVCVYVCGKLPAFFTSICVKIAHFVHSITFSVYLECVTFNFDMLWMIVVWY